MLDEGDRRLLEEHRVLSKAASGGGFLVPTSTADQMLSAIRAAGLVGQLAREYRTTGGETFNAPLDSTHGTAAWTAESGSYTPSDETLTQLTLSAYKSTSKIIVSEERMRDSAVDLEASLALELGTRMGVLQESAYITGDGSGKPTGILDAASAVGITTAATGSTTNFTPADLAGAFTALGAGYRRDASWLMNPDVFANLATRTDSQGALVFPSLGFDPPSLLGRPVFLSPDLASRPPTQRA
jgi:HK97 family phage major capsid protein